MKIRRPQGRVGSIPSARTTPIFQVGQDGTSLAAIAGFFPSGGLILLKDMVVRYNWARRKRSEFPITETELKLIAAAAIIGLKRRPKNG
jgi:hypothetical protein